MPRQTVGSTSATTAQGQHKQPTSGDRCAYMERTARKYLSDAEPSAGRMRAGSQQGIGWSAGLAGGLLQPAAAVWWTSGGSQQQPSAVSSSRRHRQHEMKPAHPLPCSPPTAAAPEQRPPGQEWRQASLSVNTGVEQPGLAFKCLDTNKQGCAPVRTRKLQARLLQPAGCHGNHNASPLKHQRVPAGASSRLTAPSRTLGSPHRGASRLRVGQEYKG